MAEQSPAVAVFRGTASPASPATFRRLLTGTATVTRLLTVDRDELEGTIVIGERTGKIVTRKRKE